MKAMNFKLPDQNGKLHTLKQYEGKWIIVYFYPKDSTPGCTKEACNFRDGRTILDSMGVIVLGISKDSVKSHKKFADKHKLEFTLLSDPTADTIRQYGSLAEKTLFGKTYMGVERNTYLISPDGELTKTYKNVNPMSHINEIIDDLKKLNHV